MAGAPAGHLSYATPMPAQRTLRIIEIAWSGPYTCEATRAFGAPHDLGLLAIYGSHPVFGDDALLYLDEARDAPFARRVERVAHWTALLPSEPDVYLGRLGGVEPVPEAVWHDCIRDAYRLLVFFHSPPWNSRGIDHHRVAEPTAVLNLGRRHRLALEVSNLWDLSAWVPGSTRWRPYGATFEPPPDSDGEHNRPSTLRDAPQPDDTPTVRDRAEGAPERPRDD